jgi:hypothetical protein
MRVRIDRFEGLYAVCEKDDRTMVDIEKSKIPAAAAEGDILDIEGSFIIINKAETLKRKKEIE